MPKQLNTLAEKREAIIAIMAERLSLEEHSLEQLRIKGRLDELTAVDSLLMVELVLLLEERFEICFDPEHIEAELVSDLDRLAELVQTLA